MTDREKIVRALNRVTVATLADMFGVTERTMYRWLAGKSRVPKPVITILDMMEAQNAYR